MNNNSTCYTFFCCTFYIFTFRIQVVKEGKKRKLVINGAKMEDAGKITAKTNADETSCDLGVKRKYTKFTIMKNFFTECTNIYLSLRNRSSFKYCLFKA